MTSARDIMTATPRCIEADQTLVEAAKAMDLLGVGALPVRGDDSTLVGMLTDRDIVVRCLAQNGDPARTLAGDIAQEPLISVDADDDMERVLQTMTAHRVRRVLVTVGRDLVGILSQADVARWMPPDEAGETLARISR